MKDSTEIDLLEESGNNETQAQNLDIFKKLVGSCEGGLYNSEFAMQIYKKFKKRQIHPVA